MVLYACIVLYCMARKYGPSYNKQTCAPDMTLSKKSFMLISGRSVGANVLVRFTECVLWVAMNILSFFIIVVQFII